MNTDELNEALEILSSKLVNKVSGLLPTKPSTEEASLKVIREHLRETYKTLWEEIKFADAKATALFALSGGMVAVVATGISNLKVVMGRGGEIVVGLVFAFFLLAAYSALSTIAPRNGVNENSSEQEGLCEWLRVLIFGRKSIYSPSAVNSAQPETARKTLAGVLASIFRGNEQSPAPQPGSNIFHQWPAHYSKWTDYEHDLLKAFFPGETKITELKDFDRTLVKEVRRAAVVASRKYQSALWAYTWCTLELLCLMIFLGYYCYYNSHRESPDPVQIVAENTTRLASRVDALVEVQSNLTSLLVAFNSNQLAAEKAYLQQATNLVSKADAMATAQSNLAGALAVMNSNQSAAQSEHLRQTTNQITAINALKIPLQTISLQLQNSTNLPTALSKISSEIEALRLELPKLQPLIPTNQPSCLQRFLSWFRK